MGTLAALVVFAVVYNCLPLTAHVAIIIGVLVVSVAVGVFVAKLAGKFIDKFLFAIAGGAAAAAGALVLCGALQVKNPMAKTGIVFVGILIGGFLGDKFKRVITTGGTALIGAFLFVRGVSVYAGGWPGDNDLKHLDHLHGHKHYKIYAYLGGFIFLFVSGWIFQNKDYRADFEAEVKDDKDNNYDAFEGEEESRRCGCF